MKPSVLLRRILWSTLLLFLLSLLGLGAMTVLAQGPPPEFELHKSVSHDGASRDITVTFTIEVFYVAPLTGTVQNATVEDVLPPELVFGGVVYTKGLVTKHAFDPQNRRLTFDVSLGPGDSARLVYQARVHPEAPCGVDVANAARVLWNGEPTDAAADARFRVICADLGDAPDGTNHFGVGMDAYPFVPAGFPTVFDPMLGTPPGPYHHRADLLHLGRAVSFEDEADLGPDVDPTNNILPLLNLPDRDEGDDGVLNLPNLNFAHCQTATLQVEVYFDPALIGTLELAYLNVWYDGNRNGTWADVNLCQTDVPEHIVIDYPIAVTTAGYHVVAVPTTVPVFNPFPDPGWLRVTLSEQPSVKTGTTTSGLKYGDGQGVPSTLIDPATGYAVPGFHLGETEDYLFPTPPSPNLQISKQVNTFQANFGDVLTYHVTITNSGVLSTPVAFWDPIPPGTMYVDRSFTFTLPAPYWGHDPMHNALYWSGEMLPGQVAHFFFSVRVVDCQPVSIFITNRANAFTPGAPPVFAEVTTGINDCISPPPQIQLRVHKRLAQFNPTTSTATFHFEVFNISAQSFTLEVQDALPPQVTVDPQNLPLGFEFTPPNFLRWKTLISGTTVMTVAFDAVVLDPNCITNRAHWRTDTGLEGDTNEVRFLCADLGDAPDSTNHYSITNTAYLISGTLVLTPDVAGRYPTVWESPAGEPSGPRHADGQRAWLGDFASFEEEADIGPDADGPNNILDGGRDSANSDGADDGWLNPDVPFPHCQPTTLRVRVSKGFAPVRRMYLNAWFDSNRDGDWEDPFECPNAFAPEWMVRDFVVDMSTWPPGSFHDLVIPVTVFNEKPDMPAWVRFTLSEEPALLNPFTGLADGRGFHFPLSFAIGETEDYLIPGHPTGGQPGRLGLDKVASVITATVGQVYTYGVYIVHSGGTAPAPVDMLDELPPEVELAGPPTVVELQPIANPLFAYFDPGIGPRGAVGWKGDLSPNAAVRVEFPVRVTDCPPNKPSVYNEAQIAGAPPITASTTVALNCTPPPPPVITLTKRIIPDVGPPLTEWHTVPGRALGFRLALSTTARITRPVHISDTLPAGLVAVAAEASDGVTHLVNGGQGVMWDGLLGPGNTPVVVKMLVRLADVDCGQTVQNVARWATPFFPGGESNPVFLYLECPDVGDAPDSSNHFGVPMMAYPGITATFPTVYTNTVPVSPPGPVHLHPQPFHLGPRVSFELEADLGLDLDGVNNLEPVPDVPNLDEADDGLEVEKLDFVDCQPARFPVWVSIGPPALAMLGQEPVGYLNVWVDGNRDGDWADTLECPGAPAREHIVIDWPVDVAALGPGLHQIFVDTTGPVPWPDLMRDKPAWLRVTLSDRPSAKPFTTHGDGRGYPDGFALGETEDYLLRGPGQTPEADPAVEKDGFLFPFFAFNPQQPNQGQMMWGAGWVMEYHNLGHADATNVMVVDTFDSRQSFEETHSVPGRPFVQKGNTITYTIGTLRPGERGHIFLHTTLPFTTPPGTVVTNEVTILAAADGDPANNHRVITREIPLLPPRITFPRPGTTCTGTITVTGRSQVGTFVDLYVNGIYTATTSVDASGNWDVPLVLPDGTHTIYAKARLATGEESPPSPVVEVIVDTSLVWSPLSLTFRTASGHVIIPRDEEGRTDASGWFVFLRPGVTYTATVYLCCDDPNASVTLEVPGGQTVSLTDPDGDGWFTGSFTTPAEGSLMTPPSIRLCVVCNNVQYCVDGQVLIDPEGVVYDVTKGKANGLLSGAIVSCYEAQTSIDTGETTYDLWPAQNYGQVNPQTTAGDGYFSFFTPAGTFQLQAEASGFQTYRSWDIVVVSDPVEFDIPLAPALSQTADYTITVSASGFDPSVLTVEPGAVVKWVNVDANPHTTTSITPTARITATGRIALDATDGWDSGLLNGGDSFVRQLNTAGTYTYHDHENTAYTGVVIVQSKAQLYLPLILK